MIAVTIPVRVDPPGYVPSVIPEATQIPTIAQYRSSSMPQVGGDITANSTTFSEASLVSVGTLNLSGNPNLTTVTLTNLASAHYLYFNDDTSLSDISGLNSLTRLDTHFIGANCAWSQSFVNRLLHILVGCTTDGSTPWNGIVDLTLGTSAAPSGQGITDKATLVARGATVNTN